MGYQVRKRDNFNIFWDYFLIKQKQILFLFSFIFNKNEPRFFSLIDCLNLWRHSYFSAILLRGDVHTQLVMQKVKMTFSIQPTHPPLKTLGVTKYIFFVNHPT